MRARFCSLSALWCLCIACCHGYKTTLSLGSHILDCVTEMVMAGRERIPVFQFSIIFNQALCLEKKTRWLYFPSMLSAFHRLCHVYFESMALPSFLKIFLSLCILLSFKFLLFFIHFTHQAQFPSDF